MRLPPDVRVALMAHLKAAVTDYMRACPECGVIFWAKTKRQQYCDQTCSNRGRQRAWSARNPGAAAERIRAWRERRKGARND